MIWVCPAAATSTEAFAERLRSHVDVTVLGLRVRDLAPGEPYGMDLEVAAAAEAAGSGPVHLAGVSAGATVALAAALALGDPVESVVLFEPAFIGDDDWDPAEARWRAAIASLRTSAQAEEAGAFRDMLMAPGVPAPPPGGATRWDFRDGLLQLMLTSRTGFDSADLARIDAPVLLVRGGRSSPRFGLAARRLMAVSPRAREHVFPALHHFAPPYREQPEELAGLLRGFWGAG